MVAHQAALDRRRGSIPLKPTAENVRMAEIEVAHLEHLAETCDPALPERLDELRRRWGEARAVARRLRQALGAAE